MNLDKRLTEAAKRNADLQRRLHEAQGELLVAKRNAESWQETAQQAQAKAEAAEAPAERLVTDIGRWVEAYGPGIIVYPSKEEIRAVNETPEFRIGRNATMQVVSEGLQAMLAEAQAQREDSDERRRDD